MKISKPYQEMLPVANWLLEELQPYFERLEICGSLRRKKAEVGDIELVGISKKTELNGQTNLFGSGEEQHLPDLLDYISKYEVIKENKPQSKMTAFHLPSGTQVDLFFADADNWGYIQALRTGSSDFNQYYLLPKLKMAGYSAREGIILSDNGPIAISNEGDLFNLINLEVIPPEKRSAIGEQAKFYGLRSVKLRDEKHTGCL